MIEKIEVLIINNLLKYHLVNNDEIDIYMFGIECYILKIIHYLTYFTIAMLCGCIWEYMIFVLSYILLRKYSGGIHANTRIGCLIISNFILSIVLLMGQKIEKGILVSALSILSLLIIILLAPVDNPNRILSCEEHKKFKKSAIMVCFFELILSFIGYKIEYLKWVQFGVIVGAFMTLCGKIKYFCIK